MLKGGSTVAAAQRRFYCGGCSNEVLLLRPLKGGFTVVTAQRKFYCGGCSKEVLLWWSLKGGSTMTAVHRRFHCCTYSSTSFRLSLAASQIDEIQLPNAYVFLSIRPFLQEILYSLLTRYSEKYTLHYLAYSLLKNVCSS